MRWIVDLGYWVTSTTDHPLGIPAFPDGQLTPVYLVKVPEAATLVVKLGVLLVMEYLARHLILLRLVQP